MKEILEKISSYNLFNYLLPGVLFAFIASKSTSLDLIQKDIITGAFVYYFIGLVISRFGSIVLEPILKKTKFLKFADYKDFIKASQNDPKIEILSESNNMYRTLIALFTLLAILKPVDYLKSKFSWIADYELIALFIGLLVMFLLSYRKQTSYITKRIRSNLNE